MRAIQLQIKSFHISSFLIVLLTCCSGTRKELSPEEFVSWAKSPEAGLLQERKFGNIQYVLFRQTDAYRNALNHINSNEIAQYPAFGFGEQYVLRIAPINGTTPLAERYAENLDDYLSMIDYFNSEFKNEIILKESNISITPMAYQFVQPYRGAPYLEFVFAFDGSPEQEEKHVIINDVAFGNGPIHFEFTQKQPILIVPQS